MGSASWVSRFHAAVEEAAAPVARANAARLHCRPGCADCCVDGLTVFAIEAAEIVAHHPSVLEEEPHPPGGCAFLDGAKRCRIYEHRPYVCRTQGLPLRWLEEDEETDEVYEARDICPLNASPAAEPLTPLEELPPEECWSIGPFEERLAREQNDGARVALRSLFDARRRLPIVK
ncbi:MAG: YkgJ family cysteine cluster protein [Labilithrix sp.]